MTRTLRSLASLASLVVALCAAGCLARHELRPMLEEREVGGDFVFGSAEERDRHPGRCFHELAASVFWPLPRLLFEPRLRLEQNDNIDIGDPGVGDDHSTLTRFRVIADSGWMHELMNYRIELQDSRTFVGSMNPEEESLDFRQGYVLLKRGKRAICGLKLGRQEIDLGSGLFLGEDWYDNYGRAFDGARLTLSDRWSRFEPRQWSWRLDCFAARPVSFGPRGGEPVTAFGVHGSERRAFPVRLDGLFIVTVSDEARASELAPAGGTDRDVLTTLAATVSGERFGRAHGFDAELDLGLQFGHVGPDEHFALALSAECSYVFPTPWEVRVRANASFASGDEDPSDGVSGTFRPPFPGDLRENTGLLELLGLRNSRAAGLGISFGPLVGRAGRFRAGADLRWLSLDELDAGWFDASGGERVLPLPLELEGTRLGHEIDIFGRYRFTTASGKDVWIEGGYAIFEPGSAFPPVTRVVQKTYLQIASRF